MNVETLFLFLDFGGIALFAFSGGMLAARKELDPFGAAKNEPDDVWEQPPMPDNVPSEQTSFRPPQVSAPEPAAEPPTGGGGDFLCPVPGSTFIDSWGAPRSGGRSHQGVDMMASAGTPIYAPVTGDVSHRGVSLGGLSFFLYGDNGNTYFGTHLSSYGASGRVVAGTVIGYVGATGNANGINHLHFEIWPGGGAPVNPYPTVAAAC